MMDRDTIKREFSLKLKALLAEYGADLTYESIGSWLREDRLFFDCSSAWKDDVCVQESANFDVLHALYEV